MSRKKIFNGKRLKAARTYRGKTIDVLAKEANINKKDILAFEEDKYKPVVENELKISNTLNFPREYFFQHDDIKVIVESTHIRPESPIPRVEEISYKEKLVMTHRVVSVIEEYIKFPEMKIADDLSKYDDMEELATKVRRNWGLGDGPIGNMLSLLESNGIIVSGLNVDKRGALSFTQKQSVERNSRYLVSLGNDKKSATIRNYDLAYELGYIVSTEIGMSSKNFSKDEFACAFLLPKETFFEDLANVNEINDYVELKKKWIAPISAMILRAYQLEVINYKKYMYLMREMEKQGWLKKEPLDENIKATSPALLKKSVEMLIDNKVMTREGLVETVADSGISLYAEDIEMLLGLKEGMLSPKVNNKKNNVTKVNFKNRK
ncbi:XRE family transcriptional regulator [Romboutsia sedimentorum]|uniref:XRE family transcriptional regulator n=1 Tax=Romboutsia sedimentorum TaxID=1368474 RepID=A0ABT7ECE0_9FIRM|nr:XRE family transcriptional regulator [Romboutsia sedimentorum]MDK2564590.1 XRE family transcriptional regulator [Romboutsia sedimentorum]